MRNVAVNFLSRRNTGQPRPPRGAVPILVQLWAEDGVWNASAFDLPVAAFGDTYEDARKNFDDALDSHIALLMELDRYTATLKRLKRIAKERGFYEDRIKPGLAVEQFDIPRQEMEACLA
jgi:predicted RNase H-like HicB family nuclease